MLHQPARVTFTGSGVREPNAIDFWRGLALIMIFVDHVPGNIFAQWTLQNLAISDAAELFVFLAGWSLSLATGGPHSPDPKARVVLRLTSRAFEVYRAQLVITALALAILASATLWLENPLFLEWHNAGPAFYSPVHTTVVWVLMTHQLGFFNILPLYVVLLLLSLAFVLLARRRLPLALAASVLMYAAALALEINLPTWPYSGSWFLNPFAWQVLFTAGFVAGELTQRSAGFPGAMCRLVPAAAPIVLAGSVVTALGWHPDPLLVPEPRLFFLFDKTYLSPIRLLNFLAIVVLFHGLYRWIGRWSLQLAEMLSALGRNSLQVFCVGSVVSLAGQILRFVAQGSIAMDIAIVLCGLGLMGFTAWFVEWRIRFQRSSARSSS